MSLPQIPWIFICPKLNPLSGKFKDKILLLSFWLGIKEEEFECKVDGKEEVWESEEAKWEDLYSDVERGTGEVEGSEEVGTVGYKFTDELELFFSTFDLAYWLFFHQWSALGIVYLQSHFCNILFTWKLNIITIITQIFKYTIYIFLRPFKNEVISIFGYCAWSLLRIGVPTILYKMSCHRTTIAETRTITPMLVKRLNSITEWSLSCWFIMRGRSILYVPYILVYTWLKVFDDIDVSVNCI